MDVDEKNMAIESMNSLCFHRGLPHPLIPKIIPVAIEDVSLSLVLQEFLRWTRKVPYTKITENRSARIPPSTPFSLMLSTL